MKVRMKVGMSGTYNGTPYPPRGGVAVLPDVIGAKLCAAGHAEPIGDHAANVETATDPRPVQKRRGRPPGTKNSPTVTATDEAPVNTTAESDTDATEE